MALKIQDKILENQLGNKVILVWGRGGGWRKTLIYKFFEREKIFYYPERASFFDGGERS